MNKIDCNKEKAAEILKCDISDISYYSWPQTFGSTAGPFGGIGGQMISIFQIEAYAFGQNAVLFCGGRIWKKIDNFNFMFKVL